MPGSDARNPPLSPVGMALAGVLASWLVLCDVWIKLLTRLACGAEDLGSALDTLWEAPAGCAPLPLFAGAHLRIETRETALLFFDLSAGAAPMWGVALVGLAAVTSVMVVRWQYRIPGDALALGALWAGTVMHALPRLSGAGASFTEFQLGPLRTGLGDIAIVFAAVWIAWRYAAEARA